MKTFRALLVQRTNAGKLYNRPVVITGVDKDDARRKLLKIKPSVGIVSIHEASVVRHAG